MGAAFNPIKTFLMFPESGKSKKINLCLSAQKNFFANFFRTIPVIYSNSKSLFLHLDVVSVVAHPYILVTNCVVGDYGVTPIDGSLFHLYSLWTHWLSSDCFVFCFPNLSNFIITARQHSSLIIILSSWFILHYNFCSWSWYFYLHLSNNTRETNRGINESKLHCKSKSECAFFFIWIWGL